MPRSSCFVNGYFRNQPITGQQRFAAEIADRLPNILPDVAELRPSRFASHSRGRQWIELQTSLPHRVGNGLLISLTSRTPWRGVRQLVSIYDLFPLTNPEWYSRQYSALHRRLLLHNVKHAEGIIVTSEPVRDAVAALARPGTPIAVAPAAPTVGLAEPVESGAGTTSTYFLAVGSIEPRKNLRRLLAAYGTLDAKIRAEAPLLIVGDRSAIFASAGVDDAPLPDGVQFMGRVTDSELAALYRDATAFVSTSLDEGFGIPLVEAAQTTKGVMVLSDIPVYRWVMGTTPAIYVDPVDVESIASGLETALTATADVEALRALARRFSWDASAQTIADLARGLSAT
jgi:glycosyltransferase involved in cell wall biosynthesis